MVLFKKAIPRRTVLRGMGATLALPVLDAMTPAFGAATAWLTGTHAKMTSGADLRAGISADQIAAKEFGKHTQLASLEIGLEAPEVVGACESAYGCAYYNTISWRNETTPLPMENRPR